MVDEHRDGDLPRAPDDPNAILLGERQPPERTARFSFNVLFLLAIGLSFYVMWPFRTPLLLAAVLASVLYGLFFRVSRLFGGRRGPAALLTTGGLLLVIIGPLAAVVVFASGQVSKGLAFLHDQLGIANMSELRPGALPPRGQELVNHTLKGLHLSREQLQEIVQRASTGAERTASSVLESSTRASFHTIILLIAFCFFLIEGPRLGSWLRRISPLKAHQTGDLLEEFRNVSRASILGAAIAALFQGVAAAAGFLVFGVPHPLFFGLLVLIASFVPVVGTLLVWVPAVVFLWLAAHHGPAIGLFVWCLVLVVGFEHIGKPMALRFILRGQAQMHTGLIFLSILGGLEMFGLIGLVVGPMVFAFLLAMLRIYERDMRGTRALMH
jgi:predicted PurR-regulated permease PerM